MIIIITTMIDIITGNCLEAARAETAGRPHGGRGRPGGRGAGQCLHVLMQRPHQQTHSKHDNKQT